MMSFFFLIQVQLMIQNYISFKSFSFILRALEALKVFYTEERHSQNCFPKTTLVSEWRRGGKCGSCEVSPVS